MLKIINFIYFKILFFVYEMDNSIFKDVIDVFVNPIIWLLPYFSLNKEKIDIYFLILVNYRENHVLVDFIISVFSIMFFFYTHLYLSDLIDFEKQNFFLLYMLTFLTFFLYVRSSLPRYKLVELQSKLWKFIIIYLFVILTFNFSYYFHGFNFSI